MAMRAFLVFVLALLGGCPSSRAPGPPDSGRSNGSAIPPAHDAAGGPAPGTGQRVPLVPSSHALYERVEGIGFANGCKSDDNCMVGGCSGEVCSAEQVQTPCDVIDSPAAGGSCGCVAGSCVWYEIKGASGSAQEKELPKRMEEFANRACACKDAPCAEKVNEEFVGWVADRTDARAGEPDRARVQAARTRLAECLARHESELPAQGQPCAPDGKCRDGLTCIKYYGVAGPRGPEFSSCEIRCGKGGECPQEQSCVNLADGPGRVCR